MVETTDYLIVGFIGNPPEVGFEEGKSLPDEVHFDYLGIDKSGNLYVMRGEFPLLKLLHPEYEGTGEFDGGTFIGTIDDSRFYETLKKETLTREEIYSAFTDYTIPSSKNGTPYILSTFVTEDEILNLSDDVADLCYKCSGRRTSLKSHFVREKKRIAEIRGSLKRNNEEVNCVYMIIPEKSPIVEMVAEIFQKMSQQQDQS